MAAAGAETLVDLVLTVGPVVEDVEEMVVKLEELVYTSFSQLEGKTRFFATGS